MRKTIKQLQGESDYWRIKFINEQQRAEAAEAKLAEYEKQEPFGFCNEDAKNGDVFSATVWREKEDAESRSCGLELFPLFIRPSPTVSLTELVPEEMTWNEAQKLLNVALCGEDRFAAFMMGANHNRKEILCNIEDNGI